MLSANAFIFFLLEKYPPKYTHILYIHKELWTKPTNIAIRLFYWNQTHVAPNVLLIDLHLFVLAKLVTHEKQTYIYICIVSTAIRRTLLMIIIIIILFSALLTMHVMSWCLNKWVREQKTDTNIWVSIINIYLCRPIR